MASDVDICNLALEHLGDEATVTSIEPPEGSAQADHCARFYPQARDELLSRHQWAFATTRAKLAELSSAPPGVAHAYAYPAACVRILDLFPEEPLVLDGRRYTPEWRREMWQGQQVLVTDWGRPLGSVRASDLTTGEKIDAPLYVRYLTNGTNPKLFPPAFVSALSWLLASYLAGAIQKGDSGAQQGLAARKMYEIEAQRAFQEDAQQDRVGIHYIPLGTEEVDRA